MRRSLTILATLSTLALTFPAATARADVGRAGHPASTSWVNQSVPLPAPATNGLLSAVACPAANNCLAVGTHTRVVGPPGQQQSAALAELWNGHAWTAQYVQRPADARSDVELEGLSCPAAGDCTAVGFYQGQAGAYKALAEHWNGHAWTVEPAVTPAGDAFVTLAGVWCASAASCTAVGYYTTGITSGPGTALVERWNGHAWTVQPTPANPSGAYLTALWSVACTSAASCTAVGASYYDTTPTVRTLAEHWNGHAWASQPTPAPSGSLNDGLAAVSCPTPSECLAVGTFSRNPDQPKELAERWNGHAWARQAIPTPAGPGDATAGGLAGLSCLSATQCTAVGESTNGAVAEVWNGGKWAVQPTASPIGQEDLNSVSCTAASTCTAVGALGPNLLQYDDQPLAEHE